jgi:hypothetical protein
MGAFLERYIAGDHDGVWADMRALGSVKMDDPQWPDIWSVVIEAMRRTRSNVETLIERLRHADYQFIDTTDPPIHIGKPLSNPDDESLAFREWLDELTGPLPLTLCGWLEFVGDVNLLGNHPDWPETEMLSDALVVEFEYRECKASADAQSYYRNELEDWRYAVNEDGLEEVGPFRLNFAPDALHKVNVSGGGPYGVIVPDGHIDGMVDLDGRRLHFIDYLRECFQWGGFPGFARMPGRDNGTIADLSRDLLAI